MKFRKPNALKLMTRLPVRESLSRCAVWMSVPFLPLVFVCLSEYGCLFDRRHISRSRKVYLLSLFFGSNQEVPHSPERSKNQTSLIHTDRGTMNEHGPSLIIQRPSMQVQNQTRVLAHDKAQLCLSRSSGRWTNQTAERRNSAGQNLVVLRYQ
jgi:hypothetical protein